MLRAIGKNPSGLHLKKIRQSVNYNGGAFQNLEPTEVTPKQVSSYKLVKGFFNKPASVKPSEALKLSQVDLQSTAVQTLQISWFGHSSYLIRTGQYTVLVDPVLSGYASPVSFIGKSFLSNEVVQADQIPQVDLLVITHDHYDHLDYATILKLKNKVKHCVVPLGVGSHLQYWGYPSDRITELDWWEEYKAASDLYVMCTPARHFSGRGIRRNQTLWASFALTIQEYRIFLGGDSGYGHHFREIGERLGSFDLSVLECGQYGELWPYIHMVPEQTLQASIDLKSRFLLPVHWAKFALAFHPWNEPIERLLYAAKDVDMNIIVPRPGDVFGLAEQEGKETWWKTGVV